MSSKFQLVEGDKLTKLIGTIARQSQKVTNLIQTAASNCIMQSIKHRNIDPAKHLYAALGSGVRRDSLLAYFEVHGNMMYDKDHKVPETGAKGGLVFKAVHAPKDWTDTMATKVASAMWNEAKPEPKAKSVFDVSEELTKFIDRLTKLSTKVEGKNLELLDALRDTKARFEFENYAKGKAVEPVITTLSQAVKADLTSNSLPANVAGVITPETAEVARMQAAM